MLYGFDANDARHVLNDVPWAGILIALVGAVFLALGAQFQHRGVNRVERDHGSGANAGLNPRQLLLLLSRPSWVIGSLSLFLAIACQLISLSFAPLIVVQPIGVVGLVVTAIVNSRVNHVKLDRPAVWAIILCVAGVGAFVVTAAIVAIEPKVGASQLLTVLIVLAIVLTVLATIFVTLRKRLPAVFYIIAAGVLYGFVATSAKVIINRLLAHRFDFLSILAIVLLLAAVGLGAYFVQTAYSKGSPDLVIAGLTVVDPMIAVILAIVVLNEAEGTPIWAVVVWILAGALAVFGVFQLARHQPQPDVSLASLIESPSTDAA